jgi:manganese/zinc/iron transport system ATP- binding protein
MRMEITPMDGRSLEGLNDGADGSLVIRDLTVAYQQKVVLRSVNARIHRGQVVGIIGPNGGGKSTLLKAILGVVPIVRGSVTLFGRPSATLRHRIAYVPQREVVDWDFPVTVWDVVIMGRYPHVGWLRRPGAGDAAVVAEVLRQVGMWEFRRTQIGQLSGGQQQRVFVARALAQAADVLLLDEPFNGIDAQTQEVIRTIIDRGRQTGKIVLLATHDLVSASCACDCLCCLNQRVVSYGPTQETYTPETLAATYGGPVIMLGPGGAAATVVPPQAAGHPPHAPHQPIEHPHHRHVHEPLGREHE